MFERLLSEASNRKATVIQTYNDELRKAKVACEEALKIVGEEKESKQFQSSLSEIKEIPLDSNLSDLSTILSDYTKLVKIKSQLSRRLEQFTPDLKDKLDRAIKTALSDVKEFECQFNGLEAKNQLLNEAEIVTRTKNTLKDQKPVDLVKIKKLDDVLTAYQNYHRILGYVKTLRDSTLLRQYYEEIEKAQNYLSVSELRKMTGTGAHHARTLLDLIRTDDETHLTIPLSRLQARYSLLRDKDAECTPENKQDYQIEIQCAADKLNKILPCYLKRDIEQCLNKSFIENKDDKTPSKAEQTHFNVSKNHFLENRRERALNIIKAANEYLDEVEKCLSVQRPKAPIKPLKKNESKPANPEVKKLDTGHAAILTSLRAHHPHVTKLGVAIANVVEPPRVINPRNVAKDAANLAKLATQRHVAGPKIVIPSPAEADVEAPAVSSKRK